MKIDDVIRDAPTEGTVYFLLTAYIDAVWRQGTDREAHPIVAKLPLSGIEDVEARLNVLMAEAHQHDVSASDDVIRESTTVFRAAALRLRRLDGERGDGVAVPATQIALPAA